MASSTASREFDYYVAISDKVPSTIPYQDGATLWQPALSILPGAKQVLSPPFNQLSLGRYIDQAIVSEDPSQDPSSQSTTPPGDLYLNFGLAGVIVGMLILGLLYGLFDQAFTIRGPVSAALVAYAGLPLVLLDGNLAYMLVTCMVRLGISGVLLAFTAHIDRRRAGSLRPVYRRPSTVANP